MKKNIWLLCLLCYLGCTTPQGNDRAGFKTIYALIQGNDYFQAAALYQSNKEHLSPKEQALAGMFLDNAFNRLDSSNSHIAVLKAKYFSELPDSLQADVYSVEEDNASKLYAYQEAATAAHTLVAHPAYFKDSTDQANQHDAAILWSALKDAPAQQVIIHGDVAIQLKKDAAGLNNLQVRRGQDSLDFIFDTGAGLSTVPRSTAQKFGMHIFPDSTSVGTATGQRVKAQLAVCDSLRLGNVEVRNAVFLVMNDSALAFPQIHYQIRGILGFPVISACREIQITWDGKLIIPRQETAWDQPSNLAFNSLSPVISVEGHPYLFDTGADATTLFRKYFEVHKDSITHQYKQTTFSDGGAGGAVTSEGYVIDYSPVVNGKSLHLQKVRVLTKDVDKGSKDLYGRIGQDFIHQFSKMTLNFHQMFIKFE